MFLKIHPGVLRDTTTTRSNGTVKRGAARTDHKNTNGYPAYRDAYLGE